MPCTPNNPHSKPTQHTSPIAISIMARLTAAALLAAALSSTAAAAYSSTAVSAAVVADAASPRGVKLVTGAPPPGALAWGTYDVASLNTTGWAVLDFHTDPTQMNDTLAGYAAGYLEGLVQRIPGRRRHSYYTQATVFDGAIGQTSSLPIPPRC